MKMNHFLSIADYSEPELMHILDVSKQLKAELKAGGNQPILAGKTLALVFQKASLRTRVSISWADMPSILLRMKSALANGKQ